MRRRVQAQGESSTAAPAVAWPLALVLLVCGALSLGLSGCGASLTNEFRALETSSESPPAGLTAQDEPLARAVAAKLDAAASKPGSSGYKIGPLDVVEFSVFKVPELTRTVQVAETGIINLPLVGQIKVAGRTAPEAEKELTRKLGAKYLQKPEVTLVVKEYNSQRVTVEGAVTQPGVYPIRSKTSLLQVIATAKGLDKTSDSTVVIFREVEGKRLAARFDVSQIRSGATPDPPIRSGDVIVAPTSAVKSAFDTLMKSLPITTVFALL